MPDVKKIKATNAAKRMRKEYEEIHGLDSETKKSINLSFVGDDLFKLKGVISGPPETPYAGGTFDLDINVPQTHPFHPPVVKFVTKLWHPNISSASDCICLDILKDRWTPALTMRSVLLSIQSLLNDPVPNDPQDAVVTSQLMKAPEVFRETAKYWTAVYAMEGEAREETRSKFPLFEQKVASVSKSFENKKSEDQVIASLSANEWDEAKAIHNLEYLLLLQLCF